MQVPKQLQRTGGVVSDLYPKLQLTSRAHKSGCFKVSIDGDCNLQVRRSKHEKL